MALHACKRRKVSVILCHVRLHTCASVLDKVKLANRAQVWFFFKKIGHVEGQDAC